MLALVAAALLVVVGMSRALRLPVAAHMPRFSWRERLLLLHRCRRAVRGCLARLAREAATSRQWDSRWTVGSAQCVLACRAAPSSWSFFLRLVAFVCSPRALPQRWQ